MIVLEKIYLFVKKVFIFPIKIYKKIISPILPNSCRFTPSCSTYAVMAIEKHGIVVGFFLTFYRILRCNPFCKGGYDPVPERISDIFKKKKQK